MRGWVGERGVKWGVYRVYTTEGETFFLLGRKTIDTLYPITPGSDRVQQEEETRNKTTIFYALFVPTLFLFLLNCTLYFDNSLSLLFPFHFFSVSILATSSSGFCTKQIEQQRRTEVG